MTGTYEPETKSSLWRGAVGISEVKVERAGSLCSSYCPVDLVPLGLSGDTPPGRPGSTQPNHIPITSNLIGVANRVVRVWTTWVSGLEGLAVAPVPVKRHRGRFNFNRGTQ